MVKITMTYTGDLHCDVTHGPSGSTISTDAPVDNQGRGETFSPTDLVASALGSCILTTMGIVAQRRELDISGATASVDKIMATDPVRRIGELTVEISIPHALSEKERTVLERAAYTCPVHKSLHPDVQMPISFKWG